MKDKPRFLAVAMASLVAGALFMFSFIRSSDNSLLCMLGRAGIRSPASDFYYSTPDHLQAILHYATSHVVPQQSLSEITVSFDVLRKRSPCNFLVFGLGHDSLMWNSFNPRGNTLFLEEDPAWVQAVLKKAPTLRADTVKYTTRLDQADRLISSYKSVPSCLPSNAYLKGNTRCELALTMLPEEVYEKEWDLIMIDAPRGYAPELPGRMAAIFSSAVMARNRKGSGVTHVFLHDIDRRVEKMYAEEFLCRKYLVKAVGRLWHFEIPSAVNRTYDAGDKFC